MHGRSLIHWTICSNVYVFQLIINCTRNRWRTDIHMASTMLLRLENCVVSVSGSTFSHCKVHIAFRIIALEIKPEWNIKREWIFRSKYIRRVCSLQYWGNPEKETRSERQFLDSYKVQGFHAFTISFVWHVEFKSVGETFCGCLVMANDREKMSVVE